MTYSTNSSLSKTIICFYSICYSILCYHSLPSSFVICHLISFIHTSDRHTFAILLAPLGEGVELVCLTFLTANLNKLEAPLNILLPGEFIFDVCDSCLHDFEDECLCKFTVTSTGLFSSPYLSSSPPIQQTYQ